MNGKCNLLVTALLALSVLLTSCTVTVVPCADNEAYTEPTMQKMQTSLTEEISGVWIATAMNIDFPSSPDLSPDELKAELDEIIMTAKSASLSAIFFQVRPSCDALYDSDIFPVSAYLFTDGTLTFDPLDYLVSEAHKSGIAVHAWVNPLRVTASVSESKESAFDSLPQSSPARTHADKTVFYADGKLYFDAGQPAVRQLVADGTAEIVRKYDVDGVIIDDYFYPYPVYDTDGMIADFADARTYRIFGGACASCADFRRASVNKMVEAIYAAVKEERANCLFGVSPYGIWQNDDGTNGGSKTNGLEAYSSIYCDALAWIAGGYIDYIAPQIPWRMADPDTPFASVASWWDKAVRDSGVGLLISYAPYRYGGEWDDPAGEMTAQIGYARSLQSYCGSIFYGYGAVRDNINQVKDEIVSSISKTKEGISCLE